MSQTGGITSLQQDTSLMDQNKPQLQTPQLRHISVTQHKPQGIPLRRDNWEKNVIPEIFLFFFPAVNPFYVNRKQISRPLCKRVTSTAYFTAERIHGTSFGRGAIKPNICLMNYSRPRIPVCSALCLNVYWEDVSSQLCTSRYQPQWWALAAMGPKLGTCFWVLLSCQRQIAQEVQGLC